MANSHRSSLGATRARQGRLGRPILWVLLFGTLLAALALFGAWTWKSGDLAEAQPDAAVKQAEAQSFTAPEPAPVNPPPSETFSPN